MKKAFRIILSATLLAVLGITEIQAPASCQMAYGGFLAAGCPMPCCRTNLPKHKCPSLQAAAPRDSIASSVPTLENTLVPLHPTGILSVPMVRPVAQFIEGLVETAQRLLSGPPPSVRAPPSDVQLLDA